MLESLMTESQYVNRFITKMFHQGKLEMARSGLLKVLRSRFPAVAADEIRKFLDEQTDSALLERWMDLALVVASYEDFLHALRG